MTVFADSSALVKLYADEVDAAEVRALDLVVASALARVEVPAAIWKKYRMGTLSRDDAAVLATEFEADFRGTLDEDPRFAVVTVSPSILENAARLVSIEQLRAYDAIQLASALAAREADPDCHTFACFDQDLERAAVRQGMVTLSSRD